MSGGTSAAALGVRMHFGVAFLWSAMLLLVVLSWRSVRGLLASPYGLAKVGSLYGPLVWLMMSLIVIPALVHREPTIGIRWWASVV